MAEFFCKFRRQGQRGVGHALKISPGIGEAPAGQEVPVHLLPDAVGVDEGAVQIK